MFKDSRTGRTLLGHSGMEPGTKYYGQYRQDDETGPQVAVSAYGPPSFFPPQYLTPINTLLLIQSIVMQTEIRYIALITLLI